MKKIRGCIIFLLLIMFQAGAQETEITGNWYSKDGTRQYLIREMGNGWEALLVRSQRKTDTTGKIVLSRVQKNKRYYRGYIYSVTDNTYTTVTIRASRKNKEVLVLKLKRLLLLDVTIKWYRDPK
jgi:uncharacterized protein (DUF2147 family)